MPNELKRNEKHLNESEEKYKLILDNANDLITIINENLKHEYINEKAYFELLGYSREDIIGKIKDIEYDKNDLIGTTFTIEFGSLDDISNYTTSMDRETRQMTITKLTDEEYQEKLDERESAIAEYWDYESLTN